MVSKCAVQFTGKELDFQVLRVASIFCMSELLSGDIKYPCFSEVQKAHLILFSQNS